MSFVRDRRIPIVIIAICGIIPLYEFFLNIPTPFQGTGTLTFWSSVIVSFSMLLGALLLLTLHVRHIRKRTKGQWPFSIWLIVVFILFIGVYIATRSVTSSQYSYLYNTLDVPLDTGFYAMVGLFIASASWRAFRARNVEASIMIIVAILIMLYNLPLTQVLSPAVVSVGGWVFTVPVVGASRAFLIAAALGSIIMAIRVLLGYEKVIAR